MLTSPLPGETRRSLLRLMAGLATLTGGASLAGCGGEPLASTSASTATAPATSVPAAPSATASTEDAPLLNFALNLQYLAAQFYAHASTNAGLPAAVLTGSGAQGAATDGRQLLLASSGVGRYASEIASDKAARLAELRAALGGAEVSQPAMELSAGAAPASAGDAGAAVADLLGSAANAFGSDQAFLSGALLFEDVSAAAFRSALGLSAANGASSVLADLLADATYHAGLLRSALLAAGASDASLKRLSDARQRLDRVEPPEAEATADGQDIVTSNGYASAFTRSPAQALNVLYLSPSAAPAGGFFPAGLNGDIRQAA